MLNVFSLFSGIGAFEKALVNLNIEHKVIAYCDIDKYASKAYSAIHNIPEIENFWDVTEVDILDIEDRVDIITYGFPCQDISNSGTQKGFFDENGNRTRSGLFFEALRIIDDYNPKFAIAENVKALTSKKFFNEFRIVLESLEEIGYNNYYAVLNAKDFGIPQNRERVFIVSIRKDIDVGFTFPEGFPLELRLKDLLEDKVDEKFYLSEKMINYLFDITEKNKARNNGNVYKASDLNGCAKTITTREGSRVKDNFIEEPISIREATKKGYAEAYAGDSINLEQINSKTRRGRVGKGVAQTLTTSCNQAVVVRENVDGLEFVRIRKLTPTECYKLMGFTADDCKKASDAGISNTQLYKQAGNSIVVNVLEAIFTELGKNYDEFRPGLRNFERE